jgi:hypothetical protein
MSGADDGLARTAEDVTPAKKENVNDDDDLEEEDENYIPEESESESESDSEEEEEEDGEEQTEDAIDEPIATDRLSEHKRDHPKDPTKISRNWKFDNEHYLRSTSEIERSTTTARSDSLVLALEAEVKRLVAVQDATEYKLSPANWRKANPLRETIPDLTILDEHEKKLADDAKKTTSTHGEKEERVLQSTFVVSDDSVEFEDDVPEAEQARYLAKMMPHIKMAQDVKDRVHYTATKRRLTDAVINRVRKATEKRSKKEEEKVSPSEVKKKFTNAPVNMTLYKLSELAAEATRLPFKCTQEQKTKKDPTVLVRVLQEYESAIRVEVPRDRDVVTLDLFKHFTAFSYKVSKDNVKITVSGIGKSIEIPIAQVSSIKAIFSKQLVPGLVKELSGGTVAFDSELPERKKALYIVAAIARVLVDLKDVIDIELSYDEASNSYLYNPYVTASPEVEQSSIPVSVAPVAGPLRVPSYASSSSSFSSSSAPSIESMVPMNLDIPRFAPAESRTVRRVASSAVRLLNGQQTGPRGLAPIQFGGPVINSSPLIDALPRNVVVIETKTDHRDDEEAFDRMD